MSLAQGSLEYDLLSGKFDLQWPSWDLFTIWKKEEQEEKVVEYIYKAKRTGVRGDIGSFATSTRYTCGRQAKDGSKYVKINPDQKRKLTTKRTGCDCTLIVKTYIGIPQVLGYFTGPHSHELGEANLRHTHLSADDRDKIADMVSQGMDTNFIVKVMQAGIFNASHLGAGKESSKSIKRSEMVTRADVLRIKRKKESEIIRLDRDDGLSVDKWVSQQSKEDILAYKNCAMQPPEGSGIAPLSFVLIYQTQWQRERLKELGDSMLHIDGTHNLTCYENLNQYTILGRDNWGHGVPLALCYASEGTEEIYTYFLQCFQKHNPHASPRFWMSDKDRAQMNAIQKTFPRSILLLCSWHVLHAWRKHIHIPTYPKVWKMLQDWRRTTDAQEFENLWNSIQESCPPSFKEYIEDNWLREVKLWSALHRKDRTIHETSDTNMLIEAWHHVQKSTFLHGLRNRRMDHLLYTIKENIVPHYIAKFHRMRLGFEGADLEEQKRDQIICSGSSFPRENITKIDTHEFMVRSATHGLHVYKVDTALLTCECLDFPQIHFCKHLYAVAAFHPDVKVEVHWMRTASELDRPAERDENGGICEAEPIPGARESENTPESVLRLRHIKQMLDCIMHGGEGVAATAIGDDSLKKFELELKFACTQMQTRHDLLPNELILPPHKKTSTETAEAYQGKQMLPTVKTKKRQNNDPYGAGEASGKYAKKDVVKLPRTRTSTAATEGPPASAPQPEIRLAPPASPALPLPATNGWQAAYQSQYAQPFYCTQPPPYAQAGPYVPYAPHAQYAQYAQHVPAHSPYVLPSSSNPAYVPSSSGCFNISKEGS